MNESAPLGRFFCEFECSLYLVFSIYMCISALKNNNKGIYMYPVQTTTVLFDIITDQVAVRAEEDLFKKIETQISNDTSELTKNAITQILKKESSEKGFGIGNGIAVVNGKIPGLNKKIQGFMRLKKPIRFDNEPDDKLVDIVPFVLSPKHHGPLHLRRLSRVTRVFRNAKLCENLRTVTNCDGLEALLNQTELKAPKAAA